MPCEEKDILRLYEAMLRDHRKQMLAFCYNHSTNVADADMLFVAIANDLWRSLPKLRPDSTPRQRNRWLQRVMYHAYVDYRKGKYLTESLGWYYGIAVESDEEVELLAALLEHLNPEERIFLEERFHGYSPAEQADMHGVSVDAIYQRYHRLILKLRNIYKKYYE